MLDNSAPSISSRKTSPIKNGTNAQKQKRPLSKGALILVAPFVVVMILVGVLPAIYALVESFTSPTGSGFTAILNYVTVITNFRFLASFANVGLLLAAWLPMMIIGVVGMALLVDATRGRFGRLMMFIYYIPGALAGMTNFMLWLLLIDPGVSPINFLLRALGATSLDGILASSSNVVLILAAMLFFEGAGSWILIVYGGLNSISDEVLDAAKIDGCNMWSTIWHVKLPLIKPWIGYLALMNFAYGFQIFLEPQVLNEVAQGLISPQWSPNQLSYTYAYAVGNTGAAAALSIILLVITLAIAMIVVTRTGILEQS
ncbi:MAG: sugar ABC transporter permease [Firmicutes bacterium]|nr:sugar ABC transporter permease [Bacillota bacterium]MCL5971416.1 sugar ABC transporter permease [Bacillota bacterium]